MAEEKKNYLKYVRLATNLFSRRLFPLAFKQASHWKLIEYC